MLKLLFSLFIGCMIAVGQAEARPSPADQAFTLSAHLNQDNQLFLQWKIAPQAYLNRDHLYVTAAPGNQVPLGKITLPLPHLKRDSLGVYPIYTDALRIAVPLLATQGVLALEVQYQGCSEQGLCYPPVKKTLQLTLPPLSGT